MVLLALASMYLGTAFPNDALAAVVLGWGIAAAVHLVFKSPGGRPTAPQVQMALAQLGVDARDVHLDPVQRAGSTAMLAEDAGGPLTVKVIGRDEADGQLVTKVGRWIAYKDSGPTLYLSRLQQVEHEAYTMLLAQGDGVRVPRVLVAGTGGPGAALLVSRTVEGPRLAELEPKQVTQKLLVDLWKQVAQLHDARVAHGALNTRNVIVGPDGPAIVEFSSSSATSQTRQCDDVAELLASTAALVGEERPRSGPRIGASAPKRWLPRCRSCSPLRSDAPPDRSPAARSARRSRPDSPHCASSVPKRPAPRNRCSSSSTASARPTSRWPSARSWPSSCCSVRSGAPRSSTTP